MIQERALNVEHVKTKTHTYIHSKYDKDIRKVVNSTQEVP